LEGEKVMKKLLILMALAGSSMFGATRVVVGINIGGRAHYRPPVVVRVAPCPGPGYYWVPGHWYYVGPHRHWRAGYWARRTRVQPRHEVRHNDFRHDNRQHGR
jgi:hypothetical protein